MSYCRYPETDVVYPQKKCKTFEEEWDETYNIRHPDHDLMSDDDDFDLDFFSLTLEEEYIDNGLTKITDLNEYCLRHLFSFLSVNKLIDLRSVCTHLKTAVDDFLRSKKGLKVINYIANYNMNVTSRPKSGDLKAVIDNSQTNQLLREMSELCPGLEALELTYITMYNMVIDIIIHNFYSVKHLSFIHPLSLTEDNINIIIDYFGPHLKSLTITDSDLREQCLESIVTGFPNLTSLDLSGNPDITGECFSNLNCELSVLRLSQCNSIHESGLFSLVKSQSAHSLSELVISGMISDYMIAIICAHMPQLKTFHCVYGCTREIDSEDDHLSVIGILKELERLSLQEIDAYFGSLDDKSLFNIISSCGQLRQLELHIGSGERLLINDKYLSQIHDYCPLIQSLKLYNFEAITDKSLNSFSKLSQLKELELINLYNITDEGVAIITDRCRNLTSLCIYFDGMCNAITNLSLTACVHMCRSRPKALIEVNFFETLIAVPFNMITPLNMRLRVSWYRPTPEGRRYTEIKLPVDKQITSSNVH